MSNPGLKEHARALSRYNTWMNDRLFEVCSQLSDEERKRDVGAFFKSIHGTLNHILLADRIWMGRFEGSAYAFTSLRDELYADFHELRGARVAEDERISRWVEALTDEALGRELAYVSAVNPQPRRYPLWFAVSHFFNHQTHHRGQVTTLLSQRGLDPGVTDLIWMPGYQREERL